MPTYVLILTFSFELQDRETCVSLLIEVKQGNVVVTDV